MQLKETSSLAESVKELWDTCSIRGLIILSLLLQSFLILFAPLRRQEGGRWVVMIPLWIAYILADWVAIFAIGLILRAEWSGILALWSSFLLLHLGGPDTITSFSIEDNELWIRHLFGLLSRVGSSVYIILLSLSNDMLWLPTLLILIAGIIKYAERNHAFCLASFDHFGNNWEEVEHNIPAVPVQLSKLIKSGSHETTEEKPSILEKIAELVASCIPSHYNLLNWLDLGRCYHRGKHQKGKSSSVETTERHKSTRIEAAIVCLLGVNKKLLVGPPLSLHEKLLLPCLRPNDMHKILEAIEIHLSLLYEILHTKFPVVDSKSGYVGRIVNLGCILGALMSFSLLKKHHYKLFDIWLTYGLLIGALALDLISIMLLISSDWITMAHFQKIRNSSGFFNKRRWSNSIPQLDIFRTSYVRYKEQRLAKESSHGNGRLRSLFRNLVDNLDLKSFLRTIRIHQWVSFEVFEKDKEWQFIITTLQKFTAQPQEGLESNLNLIKNRTKNLLENSPDAQFVKWFGHTEILLTWHMVTSFLLFPVEDSDHSSTISVSTSASASASNNFNFQRICKLLSNYMFYILVWEPTMITATPNSWKTIFEGAHKDITIDWLMDILQRREAGGHRLEGYPTEHEMFSVSKITLYLIQALERKPNQWEIMAEVWVCIICYVASSCQPIVHARQVSRGGQLLTFVWLLIHFMEPLPPICASLS